MVLDLPLKSVLVLAGVVTTLFWLLLGATGVSAKSSLGISPAYLKVDNLLPGSVYEQEIVLSRSTPETQARIELELNAPGIEKWVTIEPNQEFSWPAGQQRYVIKMIIKVPSDAELKSFNGELIAKLLESDTTGQVKVVPAVKINLGLQVGNLPRSEIKVKRAVISDFYERERTFPYSYWLKILVTLRDRWVTSV